MTNVVLCRPTDTSITASVLPVVDSDIYLEYGTSSGTYTSQTSTVSATQDVPYEVLISGLTVNTQYYYRLRISTGGSFSEGIEYKFHTQRNAGDSFTFTIIADPHYGDSAHYDEKLYDIAVDNVLEDDPDFHIDLGDDSMISQLTNPTQTDVENEISGNRPQVSAIAQTAPLFYIIGNREMERGWLLDGTADNEAVWSANARKKYCPQPEDGTFYSGNTTNEQYIGLRQDYYHWVWGDVCFVMLFPWWTTTTNPGQSGDNWDWTMGDDQYTWFKSVVENSTEKYKFVFIHHVLGGVRGGAKWSTQYEWGDDNGLAANRSSTWTDSIHKLMVDNGVDIVFQGHDHIYVKQDIDDMVYQTCPFPAENDYNLLNSSEFDGGVKKPNSGHIRVQVSSSQVSLEYVRAYLPGDGTNGEIAHSYVIPQVLPLITYLDPDLTLPNTFIDVVGLNFGNGTGSTIHFGTRTYNYPHNKITSWSDILIVVKIPNYACSRFGANDTITRDVWVTVDSVDSAKVTLTIQKPASC